MKLTIDTIKETVSDYYGIPMREIDSKTRVGEVVKCRFFIFKYSKKYLKYSLARAGMIFEQDHATVLSGIKTINNLIETEKKYFHDDKCMQKAIDDYIKAIKDDEERMKRLGRYAKTLATARQNRSLMFRSGTKR